MNKLAIVGTAPSGKKAPVNDPSFDIWGCGNRSHHNIARATRWYELHRLEGEAPGWAEEWRKTMRSWPQDCDVWMFWPEQGLGKNIVQLDPSALVAKYGTYFMSSTFSWMMAQAIEEGYKDIYLMGVDMEYGTEYKQQRAGLRHFIDLAKVLGIEVSRISSSGIAFEPLAYPFWMDDPLISKTELRRKHLRENKGNFTFQFEGMRDRRLNLEGALAEAKRIAGEISQLNIDAPIDLATRITKLEGEIKSITNGELSVRDDMRIAEGALKELDWLADYLHP